MGRARGAAGRPASSYGSVSWTGRSSEQRWRRARDWMNHGRKNRIQHTGTTQGGRYFIYRPPRTVSTVLPGRSLHASASLCSPLLQQVGGHGCAAGRGTESWHHGRRPGPAMSGKAPRGHTLCATSGRRFAASGCLPHQRILNGEPPLPECARPPGRRRATGHGDGRLSCGASSLQLSCSSVIKHNSRKANQVQQILWILPSVLHHCVSEKRNGRGWSAFQTPSTPGPRFHGGTAAQELKKSCENSRRKAIDRRTMVQNFRL